MTGNLSSINSSPWLTPSETCMGDPRHRWGGLRGAGRERQRRKPILPWRSPLFHPSTAAVNDTFQVARNVLEAGQSSSHSDSSSKGCFCVETAVLELERVRRSKPLWSRPTGTSEPHAACQGSGFGEPRASSWLYEYCTLPVWSGHRSHEIASSVGVPHNPPCFGTSRRHGVRPAGKCRQHNIAYM